MFKIRIYDKKTAKCIYGVEFPHVRKSERLKNRAWMMLNYFPNAYWTIETDLNEVVHVGLQGVDLDETEGMNHEQN